MSKKIKRPKQPMRASEPKGYRTEKYVEHIFTVELGVLQAATLLPDLTDGEVLAALNQLANQSRSSGLPHFREQPTDPAGLLTWLIVQVWEDLFRRCGRLSSRDISGILETVIESAEMHVRKPGERRYLDYLKKFMKRAGVSLQAVPASELEDTDRDDTLPPHDMSRMPLVELGVLWLRQPDLLGVDDAFENQAQAQVAAGKSEVVIKVCQRLLTQTQEVYIQAVLYTVLGAAYRHLGQLEQAVTMFRAAQSSDPSYTEALNKLAETYRAMGQYEQAIQAWRQCLLDAKPDVCVYQQIAQTCRQMGDLVGEEEALRALVAVRQRRGLWNRLWRRHRSVAALSMLADCLLRQGKQDEWQTVVHQLERSWPHPDDRFDDWAYWVRFRLERQPMIESLLSSLRDAQRVMPEPIWSLLLQACVYDWMGQPQRSAPMWTDVREQLMNSPRRWVPGQARDILGGLLPQSSPLFALIP